MKLRRYRRSRGKGWIRFICVGLGFCLLTGGLLMRAGPLIEQLSQSRAESITLKIINEQVNALLATNQVAYENLVTIGYNNQNGIAYVSADTGKLNGLKAQIGTNIQHRFDTYNYGTVSLPLGTLLGSDYFAGRGPVLQFPLELSCSIECSFTNGFDSAGINQTRHQIMLTVTGTTLCVAPWYQTAITVTTNFMVTETVLVGTVPEYYTNVQESDSVLEDVNNYGFDPS